MMKLRQLATLAAICVNCIQESDAFQMQKGSLMPLTNSDAIILSLHTAGGGKEPLLRSPTTELLPSSAQLTRRSSFIMAIASFSAFVRNAAASENISVAHRPAENTTLLPPNWTKSPARREALEESISGFVAGATLTMAKTLVKYPLDTATVRLQMPNSPYSVLNPVVLLDGSYRGVLNPLFANIPAGAIFFAVKDFCQAGLQSTGWPKWLRTSLAVAVAQIPYWVIRNPSEVVKTRQQAGIAGYVTDNISLLASYEQVRQDARLQSRNATNGLEGFYVGYWENILYAYPADVIKFVCYEQFTRGRKDLSPLEGAVAGGAATAIAQFITTPLDVVRNRIMAGTSTTAQKPATTEEPRVELQQDNAAMSPMSASYVARLAQLARQEGIQGLFAGATPRVGKALLSGAIQFAAYEETKQEFAKLFENRK